MSYLLDTQSFIWMDSSSKNLSATARSIVEEESNHLFVSIASIWEMQIKYQLGKLKLRSSIDQIVADQQGNDVQLLPIRLEHIYALSQLPQHHRDPFDRIIIAQAQVENLIIISSDSRIKDYGVQVVW